MRKTIGSIHGSLKSVIGLSDQKKTFKRGLGDLLYQSVQGIGQGICQLV